MTAQTRGKPRGATKGKHPFPVRCAAVDVGSNAIRLLVTEFSAPGRFTVLASDRSPVRLGHGVFLSGRLSTSVTSAALEVLGGYARRLQELKVTRFRAVTTSAVRESSNGKAFLASVKRRAGFDLEIISGSEEARLVFRAVSSRVDLSRGLWMMADLGGGSVEVSLADASGVLWSESHTMGSVRLLEELSGDDAEPGAFLRLLKEYADTLRVPEALEGGRLAGLVATGGNMESLAQLAMAAPGPGGLARVSVSALSQLIRQLSKLSYRQRVSELGLREDRADVILPAAIVYERLARLAKVREITVPFVGVKEGVVLDLVDGLSEGLARSDQRERQVSQAAVALGRKYRFDEAHGKHVTNLALELFDQLLALHGLGAEGRQILHAAALLHDIGAFVSYSRHHKHSLYLIQHANLPEFTPRQILMAANVARYHRRSTPKLEHYAYEALAPDDRQAVRKLAALLRLADAMDREHRQKVTGVKARVRGRQLHLALEGKGDLLLEGWALKRKSDLFKETYGLSLEVAETGKGARS